MSPASSFFVIFWNVIPDISSPFKIADCIGLAPRKCGRSEKWMFIIPCFGIFKIDSGKIIPNATTIAMSNFVSWKTFFSACLSGISVACNPNSCAQVLTGHGVSICLRPTFLSGGTPTPTTSTF